MKLVHRKLLTLFGVIFFVLLSGFLAVSNAKTASAASPDGSLVVSPNGTVYLISNSTRQPFRSPEVFFSYGYGFGQVIQADADDLALPEGSVMVFRDGALIKDPSTSVVYLVADGQKRGFPSAKVFKGLGYNFFNIIVANPSTIQDLPEGQIMSLNAITHPVGTLVNDHGTIYLITTQGRQGFVSAADLFSHGYNFVQAVTANDYDRALPMAGVVLPRPCAMGSTDSGSGCVPVPRQLVTVLSPNGGETYKIGDTINIRWSSNGFASNLINISLFRTDETQTRSIVTGIRNTGGYSWVVPQDVIPASYVVHVSVPDAQGNDTIENKDADSSDAPFSIVSGSTGVPVISGVSGPTTLKVGETGTWTVKASDPNGGTLTYSVVWGDEPHYSYPLSGSGQTQPYSQTATFTHAYSSAGYYVPTFYVSNASGQSAQTSVSVNVGGTVGNTPPKLFTPFAVPANIQPNQQVSFSWSATDANNDDLSWGVDWGEGIGSAMTCRVNPISGTGQNWHYNASHVWSQAGVYTVRVTVNDCKGGSDSNSFSVTVGSITQPSITVLSPNGGEQITMGSVYTIRWSSQNLPASAYVDIGITKASLGSGGSAFIAKSVPNTGSYSWNTSAALITQPYSMSVLNPGNDYTIAVEGTGNYSYLGDGSNAPFSIVSQTSRPPEAPFNLTVANAIATDGTAKLYWENVNGEKFYVYKNKNDGGFQFLDVTTNKYYKDTSGLSPDVKYGYYVTAVNGYGESQPSSKVYVYPTATQPSITVLSPNGGEQWAKGTTQTIKWQDNTPHTTCPYPQTCMTAPTYYDIQLVSYNPPCTGNICPMYPYRAPYTIAKNVGNTYYSWTVGAVKDLYDALIPDGSYTIQVCQTGSTTCDQSDAPFSIVATITVPTLKVSLDPSTPAAATLNPGQSEVKFASIKVTALKDAVNNMNAVQIGSDSANAVNFLTNFKIYDGTTLLSFSAFDLEYNGSYYYKWMKVSGFSVPAYSSKVLSVVADVKPQAPSGTVRLGIAGWNFDSPGAQVEPFGTPIYGNPVTISSFGTSSITVVSPNGGEKFVAGTDSYSGDWLNYQVNVAGAKSVGDLSIYITDRNTTDWMSGKYYWSRTGHNFDPAAMNPIIDKGGVQINNSFSPGTYYLMAVWVGTDRTNITDFSNAPFSIVSQTNRPPEAPFNLTVANAIATDGTAKLYWENVNGEKFYVYKNKNDGGFQFLDVTTNKYYKDTSGLSPDVKYGYYVTAVNGYGESQPSSKVYVYPTATQPSLTVLSPNGGETYRVGDTLTVKWTSGAPGISQIYLVSATRDYSNNIMATAPNTSGYWSLQIPLNFPADSYIAKIYKYDGAQGFADSSDAPFSIVAGSLSKVSEQVKCVFGGATSEQRCDTGSPYYSYACSGVGTCVVDVSGTPGDTITWKSSCGGYAYTTMDGQNDYAKFDCGSSSGTVKGEFVSGAAPGLPTITGYKTPYVNEAYIYWGYAKDKDSQSLTYFLDWGDGSPLDQVTQKTGYNYRAQHAWAIPGTYVITVTAQDESGNSSPANTYQVKVR